MLFHLRDPVNCVHSINKVSALARHLNKSVGVSLWLSCNEYMVVPAGAGDPAPKGAQWSSYIPYKLSLVGSTEKPRTLLMNFWCSSWLFQGIKCQNFVSIMTEKYDTRRYLIQQLAAWAIKYKTTQKIRRYPLWIYWYKGTYIFHISTTSFVTCSCCGSIRSSMTLA